MVSPPAASIVNRSMSGSGDEISRSPTPEQSWRGCSMEEIYRGLNPFQLAHLPPVHPGEDHSVLHHFPIRESADEPPRPLKAHQKWDALHVRLPCSPKSQYPLLADDGSSTIESRWEMIEKALLKPITNSHELQEAILSYNTKYNGQWNFRALHRLFTEDLDDSEACVFFEDLLPRIIRLALRLPELVQAPIPLLKQGQTHSVSLTQQQISCLLANAFLCTFPRRNTLKRKSEYSAFPDINFNRLFQSSGTCVLEKIKCICHYFRRVCPTERDSTNVPTGVVTFMRRSMSPAEFPKWDKCDISLGITPLHITSTGTIEDQGLGLLQVDFANKYLGGGVLGQGCVQEEIRFVICPELLVSKLFTECLLPTEALIMAGCERYSNYAGYAETFEWAGNHEDSVPRDSSRRRLTHIVAIDALSFRQPEFQYREELMLRELNKAYVGFFHSLQTPAPGIASGNWGCGAFGGNATLKALLQIMVCAVAKRPLVYYTFGDTDLRDEVHRMHTCFIEENVTVKQLWTILIRFESQHLDPDELYKFIYECLRNKRRTDPQQQKPETSKSQSQESSEPMDTAASCSRNPQLPTTASTNKQHTIIDIDMDTDVELVTSSQNRKASKSAEHAFAISDDSESDLLLLEAVAEVSKKESQKSSPASQTKSRQRTLLEMLDSSYNKDSNTSKRQCLDKNKK